MSVPVSSLSVRPTLRDSNKKKHLFKKLEEVIRSASFVVVKHTDRYLWFVKSTF